MARFVISSVHGKIYTSIEYGDRSREATLGTRVKEIEIPEALKTLTFTQLSEVYRKEIDAVKDVPAP